MRIKSTDLVMLHPMAPYIASQMPDHPKGPLKGKLVGKTSRYCKHTAKSMIHFDYLTLSLLGKVMTKQKLLDKYVEFHRSYEGYRSKGGGDYATRSAQMCFNSQLKEGLILKV
jgi:hypothetical protein